MEKIETKADFEKLLTLEKALVFIFFEWSGPAYISRNRAADWEKQTKCSASLFEMHPEDDKAFSDWINDQFIDHGYGSLFWLEKGKITHIERNAGKCSVFDIETKTAELFG